MVLEVTIKISFSPVAGGATEPTVAAVDIAPPQLLGESLAADIPPPPEVQEGYLSSFAYELPPPVAMTAEDYIPPIPSTESTTNPLHDVNEPPPTPTSSRHSKTK